MVSFLTGTSEITLEQVQQRFEEKHDRQQLAETIKQLKEKGFKQEDITSAIQDVYGSENVL